MSQDRDHAFDAFERIKERNTELAHRTFQAAVACMVAVLVLVAAFFAVYLIRQGQQHAQTQQELAQGAMQGKRIERILTETERTLHQVLSVTSPKARAASERQTLQVIHQLIVCVENHQNQDAESGRHERVEATAKACPKVPIAKPAPRPTRPHRHAGRKVRRR